MLSNTATRLLSRLPSWLAVWPESAASIANTTSTIAERRADREAQDRLARSRFHLGRGRRARERARFEHGAREARRAIEQNPGDPWAHALLSQCLLHQARPDRPGARRAAERACALSPTNGYFVGLLLDVLDAQGDRGARDDALAWAWWSGAPVERWLGPDARPTPPRPRPMPAWGMANEGAAASAALRMVSGNRTRPHVSPALKGYRPERPRRDLPGLVATRSPGEARPSLAASRSGRRVNPCPNGPA